MCHCICHIEMTWRDWHAREHLGKKGLVKAHREGVRQRSYMTDKVPTSPSKGKKKVNLQYDCMFAK